MNISLMKLNHSYSKSKTGVEIINFEKGIVEKQQDIGLRIMSEYARGSYTLSTPYIKVNPYGVAPLTALMIFDTDDECKITVTVYGQCENLVHQFDDRDYCRHHEIPILGLYPDKENRIKISCTRKEDRQKRSNELIIKTESLPAGFPDIKLHKSNKYQLEPGMIFASLNSNFKPYICAIDQLGDVRWIYTGEAFDVFEITSNGHFYILSPDATEIIRSKKSFYEIDLLGKVYAQHYVPGGVHHDISEASGDHILAAGNDISGEYIEDTVVELNKMTGEVVQVWDFKKILDITREGFIKGDIPHDDPLHINAVVYNEKDHSMLVSVRNQNAIVKLSMDTNEIVWILGMHTNWSTKFKKYLLSPIGSNFSWFYAQHAPMLLPNGNLLLYDNGNFKDVFINGEYYTPAYKNYSRAVEYKIDEKTMTVELVWEFGKERGSDLYTPYVGDADFLTETGNRLITFGGITTDIYGNPTDDVGGAIENGRVTARLIEVTGNSRPEEIFEVEFSEPLGQPTVNRVYRSKKIPLYSCSFSRLNEKKGRFYVPNLLGEVPSGTKIIEIRLKSDIKKAIMSDGKLYIEGWLEHIDCKSCYFLLSDKDHLYTFRTINRMKKVENNESNDKRVEYETIIDTDNLKGEYELGIFIETDEECFYTWIHRRIILND